MSFYIEAYPTFKPNQRQAEKQISKIRSPRKCYFLPKIHVEKDVQAMPLSVVSHPPMRFHQLPATSRGVGI